MIDDVFALCFGSVEGDGALMLGEVPHNVELQYTELLMSPQHPHYYLVRLDAVAVGGEDLIVPSVCFSSPPPSLRGPTTHPERGLQGWKRG